MQVLRTVEEMRAWRRLLPPEMTVAFVPTMGFFHEGHLALMRKGRELCDLLVVSLFVNPTQFAPSEDLDCYPRDEQRDMLLARQAGVDVLFIPEAAEMYGAHFQTTVTVEQVSTGYCGDKRPGHFAGVATVVAKLFNIVSPTHAVFGQKDFQQLAVIRRMVADLNVPVSIIAHPVVREPDGLAMSSRNVYLRDEQRKDALFLYRSLCLAQEMAAAGDGPEKILRIIEENANDNPAVELEYAAIVHAGTLNRQQHIDPSSVLLLACRIGNVRLIDNGFLTGSRNQQDTPYDN